MVIIAFTSNTSKILPRILCWHFRHCAPIVAGANGLTMYQFVKYGNIATIKLSLRDIKVLGAHGWKFIYLSADITPPKNAFTCVDFTKRAIRLHAPLIQTPDALYKHLSN